MKRFLSTTAVLLTLSAPAFADTANAGFGTVEIEQGDFFASDLIGMRIYNSETEFETDARVAANAETEWDDIGEINDIIVSQDGDIRAVILGVGGFLGLGERDVSVSMDQIRVVQEEGDAGERFLVVQTSKEALEQAPAFEGRDGDMEKTTTGTAATDTNMDRSTAMVRPAVTRDGYAEPEMAELEQLTADKIEGSYVYGANDETVGEIDALLMDSNGKISEAVINVGGFLGLGEKPVAVSFDKIQVLKGEDGDSYRFYIDSTQEKLEALPEYNN